MPNKREVKSNFFMAISRKFTTILVAHDDTTQT